MNENKRVDVDWMISQLNWRYAVKKFDSSKKVSESDWKALEEVLRLSPSSYGLQPWKFLVIQNDEIRKRLTPASWNQTQVSDCSHYVVLTTLKKISEDYIQKFIDHTAQVRGIKSETLNGYRDMMIGDLVKGPRSAGIQEWACKQVYIAMGNLMNAAALMNIDTCPLEGLDPKKYDEILGLTDMEYGTAAAVAVGYRHPEDKYQHAAKVRFKNTTVVEHI
jgi:nitroreductase